MRSQAAALALKMFLGEGLSEFLPPLSKDGTGPSATSPLPLAWMAAASPSSGSDDCGTEWSWLHQTPHLRAAFEEGFQQAPGGGNRPLVGRWGMQPLPSPRMKMAAGSSQIPEASGQPLSSRWERCGEDMRRVISPLLSWLGGDS